MNAVRYRICTEDSQLELIFDEVNSCFPDFCIYKVTGSWNGQQEDSITIEIVASDSLHDAALVKCLAQSIKKLNNQESVLVTTEPISTYYV